MAVSRAGGGSKKEGRGRKDIAEDTRKADGGIETETEDTARRASQTVTEDGERESENEYEKSSS